MTVNGHGKGMTVNALMGLVGILIGSLTTILISHDDHGHPILDKQIETISLNMSEMKKDSKKLTEDFSDFKLEIIPQIEWVNHGLTANKELKEDIMGRLISINKYIKEDK